MRDGFDAETLYETHTAWYALLDSAGTPEVSRRIV